MTYAPSAHEQLLADLDREREQAERDQALEDRGRDHAPANASPERVKARSTPPKDAPSPAATGLGAEGGSPDPSDLGRQHGNRDVPGA